MNNYFSLTKEQQQKVLQAAENKIGLPGQAIEKDIWVTTILQIVFTMSCAQHLIFKGGTSISKVWNLIKRFSEDIDLAIDPVVFGITEDITKKKIKKLRKTSSVYVRDTFYPELQQAIENHGLAELCSVEVEPDGEGDGTYPEPRKVWIKYDSVCPSELDYLKPVVMLEISSRSLMEPCTVTKVKSMVENNYPNIQTTLVDSDITTANAEKPFLEKAFLIHEMFSVEGHGRKADRKSRHLYDLSEMMKHGIDDKAIKKDKETWDNFSATESYYLKSKYEYLIFSKNDSILYVEKLNNEIVNELEIECSSLEYLILSNANDKVLSIDELYNLLSHSQYENVIDCKLFNVIEELKKEGLIYVTPNYSEIVSIININKIM